MSNFKILSVVLAFICLCTFSCELDHSSSSTSKWKGTESAFTEDFDLLDSSELGSILVSRRSQKTFSGHIERNESGLITEQSYLDGMLNGRSVKKSPDGSWVEVHYVKGRLHGPMTLYSSSGKVRSVMNYSNGQLVPLRIATD